jgi:hypothetical protein
VIALELPNIKRAFDKARSRNWALMYWAIDIHETILRPTYSTEWSTEFYPNAKKALQLLSKRRDCKLILWSSMTNSQIPDYLQFFEDNKIIFDHVNGNCDVRDTKYASFKEKFYFNVLIDNKAGFDAETQWNDVIYSLKLQPELCYNKNFKAETTNENDNCWRPNCH